MRSLLRAARTDHWAGRLLHVANLGLLLGVMHAMVRSLWLPDSLRFAMDCLVPVLGVAAFHWVAGLAHRARSLALLGRLSLLLALAAAVCLGGHEYLRNCCVIQMPSAGSVPGRIIYVPYWFPGVTGSRGALVESRNAYAHLITLSSEELDHFERTAQAMPWPGLPATSLALAFVVAAAAVAMGSSAALARAALGAAAQQRRRRPAGVRRKKIPRGGSRRLRGVTAARMRAARPVALARAMRGNVVIFVLLALTNAILFAKGGSRILDRLWLPDGVRLTAVALVPLVGVVVFQLVYTLHAARLLNRGLKHAATASCAALGVMLVLVHGVLVSQCVFNGVISGERGYDKVMLSIVLPASVNERIAFEQNDKVRAVQRDPYWMEDHCRYEAPGYTALTSILFTVVFSGFVASFAAAVAFSGDLFVGALETQIAAGPAGVQLIEPIRETIVSETIETITESPHRRHAAPDADQQPQAEVKPPTEVARSPRRGTGSPD